MASKISLEISEEFILEDEFFHNMILHLYDIYPTLKLYYEMYGVEPME